jgi:hypothetical protein
MAARLTWKGNELYLGRTKMAEVRERGSERRMYPDYEYVLGPEDKISDPYQNKADARQACETEVRRLLKNAGAEGV